MKLVSVILIAALCLSGCGAIMHGTDQEISINSSPTQAKVYVNGEERTTPAVYDLKRKNSYLVRVSKEGYEPAEVMINKSLDWTAWADLFIFGVIPIFYDLASGAAYKLSPEEINVTLQRSASGSDLPEKYPIALQVDGTSLMVSGEGLRIEIEQVD